LRIFWESLDGKSAARLNRSWLGGMAIAIQQTGTREIFAVASAL